MAALSRKRTEILKLETQAKDGKEVCPILGVVLQGLFSFLKLIPPNLFGFVEIRFFYTHLKHSVFWHPQVDGFLNQFFFHPPLRRRLGGCGGGAGGFFFWLFFAEALVKSLLFYLWYPSVFISYIYLPWAVLSTTPTNRSRQHIPILINRLCASKEPQREKIPFKNRSPLALLAL